MAKYLSVDSFDYNDSSLRSYYTDKSKFDLNSIDHQGESGKNSRIDSTNADAKGSLIANKVKRLKKPDGIHPHKNNNNKQ